MKLGRDILYLSNDDILACNLDLTQVDRAIEAMFAAKADGSAQMKPKLALHAAEGTLFLASPGVFARPAYAGIKWVGVADNAKSGLPHISGVILLSDAKTGLPLAIMDASWITGVRTAATTVAAAKRLARKDSHSIGFVACGLQARAHLAALRPHFPLSEVKAYSRNLGTAQKFAEEARQQGLTAEAVSDPKGAVESLDIVITSTPVVPRTPSFLDAAWLSPGSFVGSVDLGVSWLKESLGALDIAVTDDAAQAGSERVNFPRPYDGEVASLVAGTLAGRTNARQRTALVFAGLGLADVAVGAAVYDEARKKGIGRVFPL